MKERDYRVWQYWLVFPLAILVLSLGFTIVIVVKGSGGLFPDLPISAATMLGSAFALCEFVRKRQRIWQTRISAHLIIEGETRYLLDGYGICRIREYNERLYYTFDVHNEGYFVAPLGPGEFKRLRKRLRKGPVRIADLVRIADFLSPHIVWVHITKFGTKRFAPLDVVVSRTPVVRFHPEDFKTAEEYYLGDSSLSFRTDPPLSHLDSQRVHELVEELGIEKVIGYVSGVRRLEGAILSKLEELTGSSAAYWVALDYQYERTLQRRKDDGDSSAELFLYFRTHCPEVYEAAADE